MSSVLLRQATDLHNQGHLIAAEALYRNILADNPKNPDALALLGVLLASKKDYEEALSFLGRAIESDPTTPLFYFYLGNVHVSKGDDARAIKAYQEALAREPGFYEAHLKLAQLFEKQNDLAKTAEHYHEAVRINPSSGAAWVKLGEIHLKNGEEEKALEASQKAAQLMPDNLAAYVTQALALDALDREEDVVAALQHALKINPKFIEAWNMLGSAYKKLGRLDDAESVYRRAIEIAGGASSDDDRKVPEEKYTLQHWDLALLELLRGDYINGFAHYRARFKIDGHEQRRALPKPLWAGEDLRGKKILVTGEQGAGDVVMMSRFLPLLKSRGATVILLAHDSLQALLKEAKIADDVVSQLPVEQSDFDFQTSIFDLPYLLGTTLDTVPSRIYIPLPKTTEATALQETDKPKVGVVWAGKKTFGNDKKRSIPLVTFADIFNETNIQFYNLTRDLIPGDAEILTRHSVIDLSGRLDSFLTTARFIAQMDLVLSCDTAVAHVAGAMGKKTWVLLPFAPDWRWLTDREDSPWYPTAQLFRQKKAADWASVMARARRELTLLFKEKKLPE